MRNMLQSNLGLITRRQMLPPFGYFFVSDLVISDGVIRSDNRGGESLFPLYISVEKNKSVEKRANINPALKEELLSIYAQNVTPEEIFYYIYAIFYSNKFRAKYAEFLKSDYPRVPFAKEYKSFRSLSEIGQNLVSLHLMKVKLDSSVKFDVQGSNLVECVEYRDGKVFINEKQFFDGIPKYTWSFSIGAYQVLDKWLKSRKNRELVSAEIEQFIQIVEIINKTLEWMQRIDEIPFLD